MQKTGIGLALLCFFAMTFPALADDAVRSAKLEAELPTLHCLGYRWLISGDDNGNAAVMVSYREAGVGDWRKAMPLRRVEVAAMEERKPPDDQGLFAGSILFLQPDTEYEVKLELSDPDGDGAVETVKQRTWKEPIAPKPLRVLHVVPGSGGGSGSEMDPFMGIASADSASMPGDLILVHAGVYKGIISFTKSGTLESPIVWRGAGDGEAIIVGAKGGPKKGERDIAITMYGVKHVFFENLSFRDAHWTFHASGSSYITVRRCHFKDVGYGYFASGEQERVFICDNLIEGVESWPRDKEARKFENRGIDISGTGHVICFNTIRNFRDGVDVRPNYPVRAIDIHNNDISECSDDAIELDFSEQNVRAYCNRITNVSMGISFQPCRGGPAYAVRNVLYNVGHETWKLHLTPVNPRSSWTTGPHRTSGGVMIHNTIVKSNPPFRVYSQEGPANYFYMRNNLYVGTGKNAIEVVCPLNYFDSDYNAYAAGDGQPWRAFAWIFKQTYRTIEDFATLAGQENHGMSLVGLSGIFAADVGVPDRMTKYIPPALNLAPDSPVVDKGEILASINDGYTGESPDIGAYEFGVGIPHYGIRPEQALKMQAK